MQTIQLSVLPEEAVNNNFLKQEIAQELNFIDFEFKILKRSIDARRKPFKIKLKI